MMHPKHDGAAAAYGYTRRIALLWMSFPSLQSTHLPFLWASTTPAQQRDVSRAIPYRANKWQGGLECESLQCLWPREKPQRW